MKTRLTSGGEKFQLEGTNFPLSLMARLVFLTEHMRIHVTDPNTMGCLLQHPCVQGSDGRDWIGDRSAVARRVWKGIY